MKKTYLLFALILITAILLSACGKSKVEVIEDNDTLRQISDVADVKNKKDIKLLEQMKTYVEEENKPGLAAVQVGSAKRMFVTNVNGKVTEFINPIILESKGVQMQIEGCLSVPGVYAVSKRSSTVKVEYTDTDGKKQTITATGFLAAAIQHEMDHLNGVLLYDYAEHVFYKSE